MRKNKSVWAKELAEKIMLNGTKDTVETDGVWSLAWRLSGQVERTVKNGKGDGSEWVEVATLLYEAIKYGNC